MRRLGPVLLLLLLAGCVPEPAFDNDPLLGGRPLPRNTAVAAAPKPTGTAATAPVPTPPSGPASPAALAAGAPAADSSSLRIGPPSASLTSAPRDAADPWRSADPAAGATLKQPEPAVDSSLHPSAVIAPPTPGGAPIAPATAGAFEQLQDALTKRGVLFQSLEGPDDQGVWRFSCGVPKRDDPASVHRVEASAAGEHGLAAIRAAIQKMDQEGP